MTPRNRYSTGTHHEAVTSASSPPARHSRLNIAWNEFIIVQPARLSTMPPCVFTDMLKMLPVPPSAAIATHQNGTGARKKKQAAMPSAAQR